MKKLIIMRKFSFLPQCFQKSSAAEASKGACMSELVNTQKAYCTVCIGLTAAIKASKCYLSDRVLQRRT